MVRVGQGCQVQGDSKAKKDTGGMRRDSGDGGEAIWMLRLAPKRQLEPLPFVA